MPHVLVNLAYAKACLRKRPFKSRKAAEAERPEDFRVYCCPFCKKWHRASRRHHKARLQLVRKKSKARRKIKALMRRDLFKQYEP